MTSSWRARCAALVVLFGSAVSCDFRPPENRKTQFELLEALQPLSNPIPRRIGRGELLVWAVPFVRAPATEDPPDAWRAAHVHARVQYLLPVPGPGARLAFNDTRGVLYMTDAAGAAPQVYLDLRRRAVGFTNARDVGESGFMGFAFHPEFATAGAPGYGKLYTAFSAEPDGAADYAGEGAVQHSVVREWSAADAGAAAFAGESRELLRVGQFGTTNGVGTIAFNPTAAAGTPDYGLLYIGFGDGGGEDDPFDNGQRLDTPLGAIARIDPLGSDAGAYGIPADNPLAGRRNAAAEIWAWGLRHPQQFSWDAATGRMFIADIGQDQIEEINLGVAGGNYGWRLTEGTFATAMAFGRSRDPRGLGAMPVFERPNGLPPFVYPVAQYDHDDGPAVAGGFVYRGSGIPALRGKYLFTDIVSGELFAVDGDGLVAGRPGAIGEVWLRLRPRREFSGRWDARLGIDHDGELYLLTKRDGWIRRLVLAKTQFELLEALGPLRDPIPDHIAEGELRVLAEPFVRARPSRTIPDVPPPRIQYLLPIPGPGARLAFNDTRGILYVTDAAGAPPRVYLDLRGRDLGLIDVHYSAFMGFAFHPEFATAGAPGYGKLYTAFSAEPDGAADYAGEDAVEHNVIREWSAEDANAAAFAGETRELLRVGTFARGHGVGTIAFNPTAEIDAADYGLLYIGFGDGGSANDPFDNGQRLDTPLGAIVRIDPLGNNAGAYGIPADNPLVGRRNVAAEIWAWGLRHPQQFSWDAATGRMFIADMGQDQIEEINLGVAGGNYGWRLTEGTFATAMAFGRSRERRAPGDMPVFERPKELPPFAYPVAQYDHDAQPYTAVGGGFVYRGSRIPALRGEYVFTDVVSGALFAIDSDGLVPGRPTTIEQVRLRLAPPREFHGRWDARLGIDHDGELYLLTKGDGWIRRLAPPDGVP